MYSNNQNFNYPPYDQANQPGRGFFEQMEVSPQQMPPNPYGSRQQPPPGKMNDPNLFVNPSNPGYGFPNTYPQQILDPMMTNFAMQYGSRLMGSGKEMVDQKIGKFVALNSLKYYFSVDTSYVLKKMGLLIFPFTNKEWHLKYINDSPLPPRQDVNAPDLYIPLMGYITYVLVSGVLMGIQDRFSPEMLGVISSQALAWVILELLILSVMLYVGNISTKLKLFDLLSFIGYKFFTVILCIGFGLLLSKKGYYFGIILGSISLGFFIMRSLKQHVMLYPEDFQDNVDYGPAVPYSSGTKRRMYFLFFAGVSQPLLIWCLSYHILGLI